MAGPLDRPIYTPQPPHGGSVEEWAYREFVVLSQALSKPAGWYLDVVNIPPTRPRDGLLAFADGTNWNPGLGKGLYVYYGATYHGVLTDPGSWASYTPTFSTSSGTITTATATGRFIQYGKTVHFSSKLAITTNGTGAGSINLGLPTTPLGTATFVVSGKETATGKACTGAIAGTTSAVVVFYDGTYPGANGNTITISGIYETT